MLGEGEREKRGKIGALSPVTFFVFACSLAWTRWCYCSNNGRMKKVCV